MCRFFRNSSTLVSPEDGFVVICGRSRRGNCSNARRKALDVELCVHRFGGMGFVFDGHELGHLHGNGLFDAFVGMNARDVIVRGGMVCRITFFLGRAGSAIGSGRTGFGRSAGVFASRNDIASAGSRSRDAHRSFRAYCLGKAAATEARPLDPTILSSKWGERCSPYSRSTKSRRARI